MKVDQDKKYKLSGPCDSHKNTHFEYLAAHWDAARRIKRGEKQTQCSKCGYWYWGDKKGFP